VDIAVKNENNLIIGVPCGSPIFMAITADKMPIVIADIVKAALSKVRIISGHGATLEMLEFHAMAKNIRIARTA
jgi:hypothetical protein